jgi:hypothetical protein
MNYDIIVLGAGSAGLNIASFMNTIKLKVLLVEKHLIGGDCLNYGCVPSKALISLAHTVGSARNAERLGLRVEGAVDMKKIAETIAARQEVIRVHENPGYFRDKGIDVEIGAPRFISPRAISINNKECTARRIVIATGSRPAVPPIEGLDTVDYFTNESVARTIESLQAGDGLEPAKDDPTLLTTNQKRVLRLSASAAEKMQKFLNRGYEIVSIHAEYIVIWKRKEDEKEYRVVLPLIKLKNPLARGTNKALRAH